MKTKPLRLLRQKRASWLKSVFVLTCLLLSTSVAMAQTKTVTGTVTDSFNEPLIGASILVKGTSTSLKTAKIAYDLPLGAEEFSQRNMEK